MRIKAVLRGGCAVAALLHSMPSYAQTTYTVSPGQTETESPGASGPVTVTGGGTVIFNTANTYTGGTTINDGSTLQLYQATADNQLGATTGPSSGAVTLGDANLNGTLDLSTSTAPVTSTRPITLNAGGGTILTGSSGSWTLNGVISGVGALTVGGSGTLTLGGSNSFTGGINLTGGTLSVSSDSNFGSDAGTIAMFPGTTLAFTASGSYNPPVTLTSDPNFNVASGQIVTYNGLISDGSSPGTLYVSGGGTLVLTNASNEYSGGTVITGNSTVQAATDPDLGNTLTGPVTLGSATTSGTLDISTASGPVGSFRDFILNPGGSTILTGPNGTWTLSGVISGTGGLTVSSSGGLGGTLILANVNTYTGNTTIIGNATLQIGADGYLGGNPTSTVFLGNASSTGTLLLTNSASSQRTIALGSAGGTIQNSDGTWTFTNPAIDAVAGQPGVLTIAGGGLIVLDAANTYSGGTTVTGGTLEVGDVNSPGASILGPVNINGGTLTGYGTVNGAVNISSGTLTGNLTVNSVNITGGTLMGHGTVIDNVTNSGGTVAPGGGGTLGALTINGNYTAAGGTTAFTITPVGTSQLVVGGNANLSSSTLVTNFSGDFHSTTIELMRAGSFTGTFANWNAHTLSVAIDETYTISNGALDLVLTQTNLPANDTPTIYPAITTVAINESQTANDTILARLTELRTEPVVDDMPMASSSTHRPGSSAGRSPYGAWFKALGGFGSTSGGGGAPGYDMHGGGFLTGIDVPVSDSAVAGVAIGYSITAIGENGGASADIDTPRLMAYGGWWHGPIALDGSLGAGYASIDSSRPISGTNGAAGASYSGSEFTAAFQASSPQHFGPIAVTPALGVDGARLEQHSAGENGDGLYDLSVAKSTTNSLRPFVAATLATRFPWGVRNAAIEPQLRLAYADEILSTSRQALVQAPGDDQIFTISGVTPSRGLLSASAGVKIETDRHLAVFANVDVMDSDNSRSYGANAGVRYRF